MKINGRLIVFTLILVILTTTCKYFFGANADWSGFSPVIAIALFSGMMIKQKDLSFLLPLLALVLSDLAIELLHRQGLFEYAGFYGGQWKNYLILLLSTLIGWMLKGKNYTRLLAGAIAAPVVYFLVSNFNVWLVAEVTYSRDWTGLMNCYVAALPFYKNSMMATLVFLPVIMFLYNVMAKQKMQVILVHDRA